MGVELISARGDPVAVADESRQESWRVHSPTAQTEVKEQDGEQGIDSSRASDGGGDGAGEGEGEGTENSESGGVFPHGSEDEGVENGNVAVLTVKVEEEEVEMATEKEEKGEAPPLETNGVQSHGPSLKDRKAKEAEKRKKRRQQKKKKKKEKELSTDENEIYSDQAAENGVKVEVEEEDAEPANGVAGIELENVEVEYVMEPAEALVAKFEGQGFEELLNVFKKFSTADLAKEGGGEGEQKQADVKKDEFDSDDEEGGQKESKDKGVSNREKKLKRRMKIAELKQLCTRPDVVEVWDATASDPKLLVFLKSYRNTVPVPRHWCQKRKYLQGKRGIEKAPFQLPDFIAATGIEKIRQAYIEKEDSKKMKQKQREKMQPKLGKMDIDYQLLHDAFFKYQTKPKLTIHGDLYYEGKEFEMKQHDFKPGHLSRTMKAALGMTDMSPPPWLINMQRYGPPPSYPHLKIPGLNAPIPLGASFGYHPGGWGKPPVDEMGRPLYGDVFGTPDPLPELDDDLEEENTTERGKLWGSLEEEEEEEEEQEEEEEEAEEEEEEDKSIAEEEMRQGITSIDSLSTTPAGVETPAGVMDVRKERKEAPPAAAPTSAAAAPPPRQLFTVLEEKEERVGLGTLMGSSHTYVLPIAAQSDKVAVLPTPAAAAAAAAKADVKADGKIDITLRPEELEGLDDIALAAKYEAARQAARVVDQREDFSDMVAEMEKKRKRKMQDKDGKAKKSKEFKF